MIESMTKQATQQTTKRDALDALALFANRVRFERIPERVRALAKLHIIDGVGVMLAGAAAPTGRALHGGLVAGAPGPGADIVGTEHATSPPMAAFANAFSGRALQFDDVQTTDTSIYGLLAHPTVPVLAAALAIGQACKVSGQALLVAYLAGVEVTARLAESADSKSLRAGRMPAAAFGGIGAAIASAKLLGLSPKQTHAALTIWESTTMRGSPTAKCASAVALRDAHSVRAAVEAALLVAGGFTVDAPAASASSLFAVRPEIAKNFGNPYAVHLPGFAIRVYPSHPLAHPAIDLMFAIVNLHGIRASEIERIEVGITRVMADVLSLSVPSGDSELHRNLPYALALAASREAIVPPDFVRLPRQKPLLDLMRRIRCRVVSELDARGPERAWTVVRVKLKNARVIEMKADVAKGSPQKPLSEIELFHKFFQCALSTLDGPKAERLLNRLWLLDEAPCVSGLCRLDVRWPTDVEPAHDHAHDPHRDENAHGRGHHAHLGHDDPFHDHGHATRPKRGRRKK